MQINHKEQKAIYNNVILCDLDYSRCRAFRLMRERKLTKWIRFWIRKLNKTNPSQISIKCYEAMKEKKKRCCTWSALSTKNFNEKESKGNFVLCDHSTICTAECWISIYYRICFSFCRELFSLRFLLLFHHSSPLPTTIAIVDERRCISSD